MSGQGQSIKTNINYNSTSTTLTIDNKYIILDSTNNGINIQNTNSITDIFAIIDTDTTSYKLINNELFNSFINITTTLNNQFILLKFSPTSIYTNFTMFENIEATKEIRLYELFILTDNTKNTEIETYILNKYNQNLHTYINFDNMVNLSEYLLFHNILNSFSYMSVGVNNDKSLKAINISDNSKSYPNSNLSYFATENNNINILSVPKIAPVNTDKLEICGFQNGILKPVIDITNKTNNSNIDCNILSNLKVTGDILSSLKVTGGDILLNNGGDTGMIRMTSSNEMIIGKSDLHNSIIIDTYENKTRFKRNNYEILTLSKDDIYLKRQTTLDTGNLTLTAGDINFQTTGNFSDNNRKIRWSAQTGQNTTAYIHYEGNTDETLSICAMGTYGNIKFKTANGATTETTRMTITKDGNVGIGITDPADKLHVNQSIRTYQGNLNLYQEGYFYSQNLGINWYAIGSNNALVSRIGMESNVGTARVNEENILRIKTTGAPSSIRIGAHWQGGTETLKDVLVVTRKNEYCGYVGIGNHNPDSAIHVKGTADDQSSNIIMIEGEGTHDPRLTFRKGTDDTYIYKNQTNNILKFSGRIDVEGGQNYISATFDSAAIGNMGHSGGDWTGISHKNCAGQNTYALIQNPYGTTYLNCVSNQVIAFLSNNSPKMTMLSNGNLGIGLTLPDEKLHISNGNLKVTGGDILLNNGGDTGMIRMTDHEMIIGKSDLHNCIRIRTDNNWTRFMRSDYEIVAIGESQIYLKRQTTLDTGNLTLTAGDIHLQSASNYASNNRIIRWTAYGGVWTTAYIQYQGNSSETLCMSALGGSGNIKFKTLNPSDVETTRMCISHDGYVGIGTTGPTYPFEITTTKTVNLYAGGSGFSYWNAAYTSISGPVNQGYNDILSMKTAGSIWVTAGVAVYNSSDSRIKTNIVDVPDNLALEQLRNIPCRYYEYIDKIERGTDKTIGFIAQEVKSVFPMCVTQEVHIIPNVYKVINSSWVSIDDKYNMSSTDLTNVNGVKYKFYVSNASDGSDEKCVEIKGNSDNTFTFDAQYTNVFCYGSEIDDFNVLDKQKLFTLNFSATQEIDRIQQTHIKKIETLETEVSTLKQENMQQQTEINTLKNELNNIKELLLKNNII